MWARRVPNLTYSTRFVLDTSLGGPSLGGLYADEREPQDSRQQIDQFGPEHRWHRPWSLSRVEDHRRTVVAKIALASLPVRPRAFMTWGLARPARSALLAAIPSGRTHPRQ